MVRGDPGRLQQVLWNLVKNAIKFTAPGDAITIATSNGEDGLLLFSVSDTGIGIEPDLLPHLFSAFEQGEKSISRKFGGLGLGLAISRKIVEMHEGRLTARSEGTGHGAAFEAELPGAW
jgi:signal transduction histidine kinase